MSRTSPCSPEGAADKAHLIAFILQFSQAFVYFFGGNFIADFKRQRHAGVGFDVAQAINTGDRSDNYYVIVFQKTAGCRVAHAVNLFVLRRIFFNISVGFGNIGFRLIIVVIGDKIFNMVMREKFFHFAV